MLMNRIFWPSMRIGATVSLFALCGVTAGCPELETTGSTSSSSGQSSSGGNSGGSGGGDTGGNGGGGGGGTVDTGWTEFIESADTKKIYVSSSTGDDANDGSTPEKAVKTLTKGKSLLRDMMPDWMLLKRGDVWTESFGNWQKSGRSETERMLVTTYGDDPKRPLIKTGTETALSALSGTLAHIAFVGMHFYAHTRDPDSAEFKGAAGNEGIRWLTTTDDLLFEDVMVQYYAGTNMTIQGAITNFKLRRSIIVDAYNQASISHSNGIYIQDVKGVLLEENVFDHNGWNNNAKLAGLGTGQTIFNHNVYVQVTCEDLTIRGNITTRASSHGFQARPGGIVENNLVIDNPIGFSFGLVEGSANPKPGGVTGTVAGNVIRDAGDISATNPRGIGMQVGNIQSATIENNILAHDKSAEAYGAAMEFTRKAQPQVPDEKIQNLTVKDNIIYDWRGGIRISTGALTAVAFSNNDIQSPLRGTALVLYFSMGFNAGSSYSGNHWFTSEAAGNWFTVNGMNQSFAQWLTTSGEQGATNMLVDYLDEERKLGSYHGTLNKEATFDAYMAAVRQQNRMNYQIEYTAKGPIDYIRAGFGK